MSILVFLPLLLAAGPAEAKKPSKMEQAMLDAQAQAQAATDASMVQAVDRTRAAYEASPSIDTLYGWAGGLSGAAQTGTIERGAFPQDHLDAFFAAAEEHGGAKTGGGETLGLAAQVALAAGRKGQALVLAERALASAPTNAALLTWFATSNDPAPAKGHCTATLRAAKSDISRYDTLTACDVVLGPGWAGAEQTAWYEGETARRAASQAAHTAQLQAELTRQAEEMKAASAAREAARAEAAAASAASSASSGSAGSGVVSVRLKVTCGEKVRMFEGSSPSSGGTYGWQSPNSVRNLSVRAGDVLCIADDRDKVQSCWTASGGSVDLEMGCGGFMQR